MGQKLILASASPRRVMLLNQAGIEPDMLFPTDVDETVLHNENPRALAVRLAKAKATKAASSLSHDYEVSQKFIIAADTVVAVGRRILPKAELMEEAHYCLNLLSGRAHHVYTCVVLITPAGKVRQKLVETKVRFKRLSKREIDFYIASGEWRGKAGAYGIQGLAGAFVIKMSGSYFNVVGLPLYETMNLLAGEGFVKNDQR
jgi:septum formation protein